VLLLNPFSTQGLKAKEGSTLSGDEDFKASYMAVASPLFSLTMTQRVKRTLEITCTLSEYLVN
jgi:hypothetical protein